MTSRVIDPYHKIRVQELFGTLSKDFFSCRLGLSQESVDAETLFEDLRRTTSMRPGPIVFDDELPSLFDTTNIAATGVHARNIQLDTRTVPEIKRQIAFSATGGKLGGARRTEPSASGSTSAISADTLDT